MQKGFPLLAIFHLCNPIEKYSAYLYIHIPMSISIKNNIILITNFILIHQVEVKRTKNTERRVQRQVVLEDGRVLNVGGPPHVVVDTIEDIETHETNHVEDQNIIDELKGI